MDITKQRNLPQKVPFTIPEIGYLRLPQVLRLIPIGKSTLWAWVAAGKFPKPVKLGPRTSVWRVGDVKAFIESTGTLVAA